MPSPFPGMDPYLEDREVFPNLHTTLITYLQELLQPKLPDPYYASVSRRTWIEISDRAVEPDVNVLRRRGPMNETAEVGGVAVAAAPSLRPVIISVAEEEWWEPYIEIYVGTRPRQRLVASIEVLSPSNKRSGNNGRRLYRRKQLEMLEGQVNLVEIDLLRSGRHTTAVPLRRLRKMVPSYDYHVCVRTIDRRQEFAVFPFRLEDLLPKIDVPLLPGDGAVEVDLQSAFNRAYDFGPYRKEIDYVQESPHPPLDEGRTAWARDCIAAWKAKPAT
jgi:hypothetical protein